jgi:hypothetical protein
VQKTKRKHIENTRFYENTRVQLFMGKDAHGGHGIVGRGHGGSIFNQGRALTKIETQCPLMLQPDECQQGYGQTAQNSKRVRRRATSYLTGYGVNEPDADEQHDS